MTGIRPLKKEKVRPFTSKAEARIVKAPPTVTSLIIIITRARASRYASFDEKIISANLGAQAVAYLNMTSVFQFEVAELIDCIFLFKIPCGESILLL